MAPSPRIYRIHHKYFSNNHKFEIDNGTDEIMYTARLVPLPTAEKLAIVETSTDKELIKIYEESHHLQLLHEVLAAGQNNGDDQHLATVKRIHDENHQYAFEISSVYGVYKVEHNGSLCNHEFKITTGNKPVVIMTKKSEFVEHPELYEAEVNDDDGGDLFLLALLISLWYMQRWWRI